MPYIQCPHCGQRALEVATRCPRCARPLDLYGDRRPPAFWQRNLSAGPVIAVVILGLMLVSAIKNRQVSSTSNTPARAPSAAVAPRPTPAKDSVIVAEPAGELPPEVGPAIRPVSMGAGARQRYASTWVNVRARPTSSAPVLLILKPGDSVLVDSLSRGWYRAVADGRMLGYVDGNYVGDPESGLR